MRRLVFIAISLAGCTKQNPDFCPAHPDDERCGGTDGGMPDSDADVDTNMPIPICFGTGNFEACFPDTPGGSKTLDGTLDTTASTMCLPSQPTGWTNRHTAACFVVGEMITINNVSVSGNRPLVVLGKTIQVNGLLDAAAHEMMPTKVAPGAPYPNCPPFGDVPSTNTSGGGGGAGGSFMTTGGSGGAGNNSIGGNHGGVTAGADAGPPSSLRGGCPGQAGGNGNNPGGAGGGAGGAVYLAASTSIAFGGSGIINTSGSGGHATSQQGGGGGGGAGGMIVLYAPDITGNGRLLANGGGGASGSANGTGTAGNDPNTTMPLVQAAQVSGPSQCCTGNVGYAGQMDAGPGGGGASGQSGGGGGGGGGFILTNKPLGSMVSPPATMM